LEALKILLGLAGLAWRAIISSMVTSFLLFAILLEVVAPTIEALDIRRNRSVLSSTQRSKPVQIDVVLSPLPGYLFCFSLLNTLLKFSLFSGSFCCFSPG
jgi:hypothetical protein